jgi:hypothetical protein
MKVLAGIVVYGLLAIVLALLVFVGGVFALVAPGLFGLAVIYMLLR